jgi:hypothetical protein
MVQESIGEPESVLLELEGMTLAMVLRVSVQELENTPILFRVPDIHNNGLILLDSMS